MALVSTGALNSTLLTWLFCQAMSVWNSNNDDLTTVLKRKSTRTKMWVFPPFDPDKEHELLHHVHVKEASPAYLMLSLI